MTNSEARKRMQAQNPAESAPSIDGSPSPASVDPATIPGPQAANLGDGANGLSEAERFDLIEAALLWFPTGEGFANPQAWAIQVADHAIEHFANLVREHTERAWDEALSEVERRIEAWIRHGEAVPADVTTYDRWIVHEELRGIVRAARQEQNR